ncbi:ribonuclease H-like domain-containing protein, partial [Tanacetum coccineum]
MIDYALWEVKENGNTTPKTTVVEGVKKVMPPTTAKEKAQKRLEVKARNTLMMGIPNEHKLKFNSIKDAKLLMEAVEKIFGGNAATKKTQSNLLKQQYENFTAPSSEMLDQTFDRLQKLLDTMSMNDLYNNLKVYEPEVKEMSSSITRTQNMDFVSSSNNNNSSTNGTVSTAQAVKTANRVSVTNTQVNASNIDNLNDAVICAFLDSQPNNPQLAHEDLQQIHPDDWEQMDLRWQMAMSTMRARRFLKNIDRKLTINGNESVGFDKSKVECYNCHKKGHFTKECRALRNQDYKNKESTRRIAEEGPNYALMAYSSSSSDLESGLESVEEKLEVYKANESIYSQDIKIVDNYKKGLGYNVVPPTYTENFMPPTLDLSFAGFDEFVNKPVVENRKSDEEVSKVVRKSNDSLIIEDWVSDSEEENVDCNYHHKQFQKQRMVKLVWNNAHMVNHQNFAKKTHPYAKKNMFPRAVLMKSGLISVNTARQVNVAHTKTTVNAARPMSYLSKKAHLTVKRPINKNTTFKNSYFNQRVNIVKDKNVSTVRPKAVVNAARPKAVFNAVKGNNVNTVKASACWVWKPKTKVLDHVSKLNSASITLNKFDYVDAQGRSESDQGVIDSGWSRHITGNMSNLTDYEVIDGGYVAFGRNPKGGKITGK